jgi:hypothetical protein
MLKTMLVAVLATGAALVATPTPASAADGCGRGAYRTPSGRCVSTLRNRGPVLVRGRYYQGRGYWNGRRYYQNRYRYRNGWRYR